MSSGAITNKVVPRFSPQQQARSTAPELDEAIIARPLNMPAADNIVLKDKSFSPRWVNYSVGEKESTLRFHQMKAAGYSVVSPAEIESGLSTAYETVDGKIVNGDVVLMKIKKEELYAALKWNWEKAQRRRGFRAMAEQGKDFIQEDLRATGAPPSQLRKVSAFVPGQTELNSLVGTDTDVKKK